MNPTLFRQRLKFERKRQGFTIEELSKRTSVSKSSINNYERGRNLPRVEHLQEICNALLVDPDWLIGRY